MNYLTIRNVSYSAAFGALLFCDSAIGGQLQYDKSWELPMARNSLISVVNISDSSTFIITGNNAQLNTESFIFSLDQSIPVLQSIETQYNGALFFPESTSSISKSAIVQHGGAVFLSSVKNLLSDNKHEESMIALPLSAGNSVVQAGEGPSGNIYVLSLKSSEQKLFLSKFTKSGTLEWSNAINGPEDSKPVMPPKLFVVTPNEDVLMGWIKVSSGSPGLIESECEIVSIQPDGNPKASKSFHSMDFTGHFSDDQLVIFVRSGRIEKSVLSLLRFSTNLKPLGENEIAVSTAPPVPLISLDSEVLGPCVLYKTGVGQPYSLFSSLKMKEISFGTKDNIIVRPSYATESNNQLLIFGLSRGKDKSTGMRVSAYDLQQ